jgi:hypothetical protein
MLLSIKKWNLYIGIQNRDCALQEGGSGVNKFLIEWSRFVSDIFPFSLQVR